MPKKITVKVSGMPYDVLLELVGLYRSTYAESPKYVVIGKDNYLSLIANFKEYNSDANIGVDEFMGIKIVVVQADMLEVVGNAEKEATRHNS